MYRLCVGYVSVMYRLCIGKVTEKESNSKEVLIQTHENARKCTETHENARKRTENSAGSAEHKTSGWNDKNNFVSKMGTRVFNNGNNDIQQWKQ